jgi:hypothetical protein
LVDTTLRLGSAAHLQLFPNDTTLDVGPMQATQVPTSGARKVDQMLTIGLTPEESRAIATATSLRGQVGDLPFEVPKDVQAGITALWIASVCGVKLH